MFKRILLFISLVLSFTLLISCSNSETNSQPEDVRDEIWEATNAMYDEIITYYQDEKTLNEEVIITNGNILANYHRDDALSTQEKLLLDQVSNLATHTFMLSNGETIENLKKLLFYDYELELEITKQLLNR